jgi:hypothetical protein
VLILISALAEPWNIEIFPSGAGYESYIKALQNPGSLSLEFKQEEKIEVVP